MIIFSALPQEEGAWPSAAASWSAVLCTAFFGSFQFQVFSFQFFKTVSILSKHVSFFTAPNSAPESGRDGRTPRRSRDTPRRLAKRVFFIREWTRRNANDAEHSFSLREKVAEGRMRVKRRMFFAGGHCLVVG
ncbi:MAG: hypothetical protein ACI8QI_001370 [Limisphaerales bacterium]|jgi:hypothetical protein